MGAEDVAELVECSPARTERWAPALAPREQQGGALRLVPRVGLVGCYSAFQVRVIRLAQRQLSYRGTGSGPGRGWSAVPVEVPSRA